MKCFNCIARLSNYVAETYEQFFLLFKSNQLRKKFTVCYSLIFFYVQSFAYSLTRVDPIFFALVAASSVIVKAFCPSFFSNQYLEMQRFNCIVSQLTFRNFEIKSSC